MLLSEAEVPIGARVFLVPPDSGGKPALSGTEQPLELLCLIGGVSSLGKKFYPTSDLHVSQDSVRGTSLAGFREDVRFTPTQIFTPASAPADTEFAVFVDGVRLKYEKYPQEVVIIFKNREGRLISVHGLAYDHWQREYPLPADAVLVATTEIGRSQFARKSA